MYARTGKCILGVRVEAVDGEEPSAALAYDEEGAVAAFHSLPSYLTRHHPDVLAAMQASGLDLPRSPASSRLPRPSPTFPCRRAAST